MLFEYVVLELICQGLEFCLDRKTDVLTAGAVITVSHNEIDELARFEKNGIIKPCKPGKVQNWKKRNAK